MACRYCKAVGHMVRDCPDKPPMICENCGEEGMLCFILLAKTETDKT